MRVELTSPKLQVILERKFTFLYQSKGDVAPFRQYIIPVGCSTIETYKTDNKRGGGEFKEGGREGGREDCGNFLGRFIRGRNEWGVTLCNFQKSQNRRRTLK